VIEEQVDAELVSSYRQGVLAAYESEPDSQLDQKLPEMLQQAALQPSIGLILCKTKNQVVAECA
jgi:hypothetical protein